VNRAATCFMAAILALSTAAPSFAETVSLDPGKWAPRNYMIMSQFIAETGKQSPDYNPSKKPYAVFDWDNTAISGDCEDALMYYMIANLKFPSDGFLDTLKAALPGGYSNLKNSEGKDVGYADIFGDIRKDYDFILQNYKGYGGPMSLNEMHETKQFRDFYAKTVALMDSLYGKLEYPVYLSMQARMFAGLSADELMAMSYEADIHAMGAATKKVELESPGELPGKAGIISTRFSFAIRLTPEMSNLMHVLQDNGIEVYVVTASPEYLVREFVSNPEFGYCLDKDKVFGVRLETKDGRLMPVLAQDWPFTVEKGKVELISKVLVPRYGHEPELICGDSDGDYYMLNDFSDTQLHLLINRVPKTKIKNFCIEAVKEMKSPKPKFILQGRDENTGQWIPDESTIKLGKKEKKLIAD
jgi:phosphoserine phosphatase